MRGLSAAVILIGTLGWVSSAEAIISKKRWDPQYSDALTPGQPLPDLGWSGEVTFNIKDECLLNINSKQWITNLTSGCVGKLSIDSAVVTLYDLDNQKSPVTLNYDDSWNIFAGGNAQLTWRMYVDVTDGVKTLGAVQGAFLFPEFVSASAASFAVESGYDAAAYWLNFNANTTNDFPLTGVGAPEGDYAFLTSCSYRKGSVPGRTQSYDSYRASHLDVACSQNDGERQAAVLVPVPEPETYLLGLASFGVLGVWARRRRLSGRAD
jgi:hypothetical protein